MSIRKQYKDKSINKGTELTKEEQSTENLKYVNGVVKFSKISVRNLKAMDFGGKSDPFVIFKAGDEEKKTSTARNTLDYDYMNEEYELIYNPLKMQGKKEVDIEVWDYDTVGDNDLIGIANVDV
ncbi:MAG: hypothetical protein EZS28_048407 [Streblomastix strix]|uniref:C2 domain-containing protein n=1 Tax=Streblomastix strix TaxID=222440 RepID=A0A5J4TCB5_9EUKA|nr:MAG: hypothetical protein EZS28_048407 [Streblomastix strix]